MKQVDGEKPETQKGQAVPAFTVELFARFERTKSY